jgi:hypothetical protein
VLSPLFAAFGPEPGTRADASGRRRRADDDTAAVPADDRPAAVTRVGERTGRRIEEDDYDELADLDGWVRLRQRAPDHDSARGHA